MLQFVRLSVCLSHVSISTTVHFIGLWLLQKTNRKPHGESRTPLAPAVRGLGHQEWPKQYLRRHQRRFFISIR